MRPEIMTSAEDDSVNFVWDVADGKLEARYVRRDPSYFICYISSQTGCNMGCRFCHLTATQQNGMSVDKSWMVRQAAEVLHYYSGLNQPAREVSFNFMARGEALLNPHVNSDLLYSLGDLARKFNLLPKYNISTIMPRTMKNLFQRFDFIYPTIYYSLYSLDPVFRRKWVPMAMPANEALDLLKDYQDVTRQIIRLHWAFIDGENDSLETIDEILYSIKKRELFCDFNLVRYNPYSKEYGKESEHLQRNLRHLENSLPGRVKLIERVGFDVKASCGMFVEK